MAMRPIWRTPCFWQSIIQRQQQDRFTIVAMKSSSRCGRCARASAASSITSSKWSAFRIRFGTAARAISLNGSVHHRVMDLFKIKTQLGYRDLIPAVEAIAKTAQWYVEHPPERGGEIEQRLQDPFDYEAEDKLIAILQEARERAQAITTHRIEAIPHPYPHPKEPNLQRDHRNR